VLTWLGLGAIVALIYLILFRVTSVAVALTLVPIAAAVAGGFGSQVGAFAMQGIAGVAPVAVLLAFAVVFFGVMNDAGLFQPAVNLILRMAREDPVRITVATAAIATLVHLDGAGASTFMITVPAMLPVYQRARMSPLTLTCATALAAGTMNMLPWGGPTTRAAAALEVGATTLFVPVIPAMVAGLITVFVCAVRLGRQERRRIADGPALIITDVPPSGETSVALAGEGAGVSGLRFYFNAVLTVVTLAILFVDAVPAAFVFVAASALALLVNYPNAHEQRERLTAHASAAMLMVTTVFAAGVFSGILTRSGMLASMSTDLVHVLPNGVLRHLPAVLGILSMPLSLAFDPDSFYFGLLPVLANASQAVGGSAIEVGRAAVLGQMTTGFPVSPLTPATFLLVGLAGVDLPEHQRRTIPYAFLVTVIMTAVALATRAITW
jgi:citrate-Mg2+:H+ or citrate-Ca2+:H+ symporter, CitMHS family